MYEGTVLKRKQWAFTKPFGYVYVNSGICINEILQLVQWMERALQTKTPHKLPCGWGGNLFQLKLVEARNVVLAEIQHPIPQRKRSLLPQGTISMGEEMLRDKTTTLLLPKTYHVTYDKPPQGRVLPENEVSGRAANGESFSQALSLAHRPAFALVSMPTTSPPMEAPQVTAKLESTHKMLVYVHNGCPNDISQ